MTIAETSPAYFLAALYRDYLALSHADWMAFRGLEPTSETAVLDVPASLPFKVMDAGAVPARPGVIVAAREEEGNTNARRRILVSCILCTWLKSDAPGAAEVAGVQTTAEEASVMQKAIENRLRNMTVFNAWLASLSTERRSGWSLMGLPNVSNATPARDRNEQTVDYAVVVRACLALAPFSPG